MAECDGSDVGTGEREDRPGQRVAHGPFELESEISIKILVIFLNALLTLTEKRHLKMK